MSNLVQGFSNKLGVILNNNQLHILRETGFRFLQNLFNLANGFDSVSIRG